MATRRIVGAEKTILDKDDHVEERSDTAPAVPRETIYKLLAFTLAMVVIPIGSYFLTVHTVFKGNSSYAGGLAALMANVVLVGYIIVAMTEDQSEADGKKSSKGKKDQ
jgi:hypothetical protein